MHSLMIKLAYWILFVLFVFFKRNPIIYNGKNNFGKNKIEFGNSKADCIRPYVPVNNLSLEITLIYKNFWYT